MPEEFLDSMRYNDSTFYIATDYCCNLFSPYFFSFESKLLICPALVISTLLTQTSH